MLETLSKAALTRKYTALRESGKYVIYREFDPYAHSSLRNRRAFYKPSALPASCHARAADQWTDRLELAAFQPDFQCAIRTAAIVAGEFAGVRYMTLDDAKRDYAAQFSTTA